MNRAENVAQGFISTDPLKDDYPHLTPFQYASNDPIGAIDLDGLQSTKEKPRSVRAQVRQRELQSRTTPSGGSNVPDIPAIPSIPKFDYGGNIASDVASVIDNAAINVLNEGVGVLNSASATFNIIKNEGVGAYGAALKQELSQTYDGIKGEVQGQIEYTTQTPFSQQVDDTLEGFTNPETYENIVSFAAELFLGGKGTSTLSKTSKASKITEPLDSKVLQRVDELDAGKAIRQGEFDYLSTLDDSGRLSNVSGDLSLSQKSRIKHNSDTPGKKAGDHAGHMIADIFGGSGELDNLVSQLSSLNLSGWKKLENLWAENLKSGVNVNVNIKINYLENSKRPSSFDVQYSINGKVTKRSFSNE